MKLALRTFSGTTQQLVIYLHGTIQVTYFSNLHNIPIQVYIPPTYPHIPPCYFLIPSSSKQKFCKKPQFFLIYPLDIIIKPRHKFCDAHGVIYHPMVSKWDSKYTILQILMELQKEFSNDPPVCCLFFNLHQCDFINHYMDTKRLCLPLFIKLLHYHQEKPQDHLPIPTKIHHNKINYLLIFNQIITIINNKQTMCQKNQL